MPGSLVLGEVDEMEANRHPTALDVAALRPVKAARPPDRWASSNADHLGARR